MTRRSRWLKEHQREILAQNDMVTDQRRTRIESVARGRQRGLMVIMEDVYNPHNLGAIARSCDAFGVQQIAYTVEDDDRFDPATLTTATSTSASKWLDYRIFEDGTTKALTTLKREGWHIAVSVLADDAISLYDADFTAVEQLALLVGNEKYGVSPAAIQQADSKIMIPMRGMIQSFNVSVATALMLSEITRQREADSRDWRLPHDEADALTADLIARSLQPSRP